MLKKDRQLQELRKDGWQNQLIFDKFSLWWLRRRKDDLLGALNQNYWGRTPILRTFIWRIVSDVPSGLLAPSLPACP